MTKQGLPSPVWIRLCSFVWSLQDVYRDLNCSTHTNSFHPVMVRGSQTCSHRERNSLSHTQSLISPGHFVSRDLPEFCSVLGVWSASLDNPLKSICIVTLIFLNKNQFILAKRISKCMFMIFNCPVILLPYSPSKLQGSPDINKLELKRSVSCN